jgi:hypothetical protein
MGFICKHFDGESYCYHKDESTTKHECEHECEISEKVSDGYEDYTEIEKEIYRNMESLNDEDGLNMGCWVKGHFEIETFKKIAKHWLWFEYDKYIDLDSNNYRVRQGYFKATPTGEDRRMVWIFKKEKIRGSIPVMELEMF